jgi:hypothetical protein
MRNFSRKPKSSGEIATAGRRRDLEVVAIVERKTVSRPAEFEKAFSRSFEDGKSMLCLLIL